METNLNTNVITKQIIIKAKPSSIFDALTTPEKIIQYFPLKQVTGQWKVEGKVEYVGEIGGNTFTDFSSITVFNNPCCFQYSYWSDNHGTENTPENHLTICYQLNEHKQGTQLELTHSNIQNPKMFEQMDTIVWDFLLNALKTFIEKES